MFGNLRATLARTRAVLAGRLDDLLRSPKSREDTLEELAEALVLADVGPAATDKLVGAVRERTRKSDGFPEIEAALKEEVVALLGRFPPPPPENSSPWSVMVVGTNGGGKTTTAAKLARRYAAAGRQVLLVAADTFRAAAQEQVSIWGRRLGVPVHRGQAGADPASVVFDAARQAKSKAFGAMIVDTAGRVHTNPNLMAELEKIKRVLGREIPGAPHEVLLVLDASTGRNALPQAREFLKFSGLTGVVLTKLDGTAKGGAVLAVADELGLPIRFIGTGESEDDLEDFAPRPFVDALFA
ncbi:MAG: signal recognition particle-docking protein FtsY [Candidatus Aminicenantes bacterium]|nr:signal recognition particle-docking protein FtsY [Candidatus Aminicenantes bacterium]